MSSSPDVAIIGGGPAGSTVGTLLKKYRPELEVLILERERFPRDHVGESQLPLIGSVLEEMGVWDEVEAAGFPIKIGATYRWGSTSDLWNFEFIPNGALEDEPRPAQYKGQRTQTAFQVDRAIYDEILLNHARKLGCEVREEARVLEVRREGDHVDALRLESGEEVRARHYVDASGGGGVLRRAMGVEVESPTSLRNIAIWDYWQNAEWAVEIGVGGTRVQVMSLGYGWIWFIPLGPTRTSVGLIVPAQYYKESGKRPEELYREALAAEPRISALMKSATSEGKFQTTNDWSFLAERLAGVNWFLAGDSCGFADPILAAGMTLAHAGARQVAFSILEIDRGELDPQWIKSSYSDAHSRRIRSHIRFADYWYSANGQFKDLVAYTSEIAKDAGLELDPDKAFQWLGTGGFANEALGRAGTGTVGVNTLKRVMGMVSGKAAHWKIDGFNEFRLNLVGAHKTEHAVPLQGRILPTVAYVRNGKTLPLVPPFSEVVSAVNHESNINRIMGHLRQRAQTMRGENPQELLTTWVYTLEALVVEGWVTAKLDKKRPVLRMVDDDSATIYFDRNAEPAPQS